MKKSRTFRKSFVAAIAALCLAAPLAVMPMTVSADEYTITITESDTANHTYKAYQVFSGTYSDGVLGNIEWSTSVNSSDTDFVAGLQGIFTSLAGQSNITAAMVVEKLGNCSNDSLEVKKFAKLVAKHITGDGTVIGATTEDSNVYEASVEAGYYLIKDESSNLTGESSYSAYILHVVEDIDVTAKASIPTIVKKVKEDTKVSAGSGYKPTDGKCDNNIEYEGYNDVADYDIGDAVPILDRGTLPTDLDRYDEYFYEIVDVTNNGMTPFFKDSDSDGLVDEGITVKIDGKDVTKQAVIKAVTTTEGVTTITVTFEDITAIDKSDTEENIIVSSNSVVTVEYNATLDADADIGLNGQESSVKLNFSNDPNETYVGSKNEPEHQGTTPVDKVIVFTYELDVLKQLANGKDSEGKDIYKNAENGEVGFKLYRNNGGTIEYAKITGGKVSGWTTNENDDSTEVTTQGSHVIFSGLDDGTYWLKETKTPAGYNSIADYKIEIGATTYNTQEWSGEAQTALTNVDLKDATGAYLDGTLNANDNTDGILNMTINNQKGSSLPSTGGIGTTIFYLGGGTMAAVAGVYLITKKRMKNEEDDEI